MASTEGVFKQKEKTTLSCLLEDLAEFPIDFKSEELVRHLFEVGYQYVIENKINLKEARFDRYLEEAVRELLGSLERREFNEDNSYSFSYPEGSSLIELKVRPRYCP